MAWGRKGAVDRDGQASETPEEQGQWRRLRPQPIASVAASQSSDRARDPAQKRRKKRRPKSAAAETFEASPQPSRPDETDETEASTSHSTRTDPDNSNKDQQAHTEARAGAQQQQQQQKQAKPEEYEVPGDYLENIAVDRLNRLSQRMWEDQLRKGLKEHKVVYKGRRMSLQKLLELYAKEKDIEEMSGYEAGMRTRQDSQDAIRNKMHGSQLRPDSHKMQLRRHEEQDLELDLYGRGVDIGPTRFLGLRGGGERKYSFGIYGRCDFTQAMMQAKWAGRDPEAAMLDQDFYDDVMDKAHGMELTIMAHPVRDLPLEPYRHAMLERLWINMATRTNVPVDEDGQVIEVDALQELEADDKKALREVYRDFAPQRLEALGMVDENHMVKAGSHWIFTVGPSNELCAEGVTAGKLKDRDCVKLGIWKYPRLTRALFDTYLGPKPVDLSGKLQTGQGILYVTNGFRFDPAKNPDNVNTFYEDDWGNPIIPQAQPLPEVAGEWDIADADDRPKTLLSTTAAARARRGGLKHTLGRKLGGLVQRLRGRGPSS